MSYKAEIVSVWNFENNKYFPDAQKFLQSNGDEIVDSSQQAPIVSSPVVLSLSSETFTIIQNVLDDPEYGAGAVLWWEEV